jgi:hypothetical protein
VAGIANKPEAKGKTVRLDEKVCRGNKGIECLASGGKFFERFLSGLSGNVSWSERDEVQQGILVNSFSATQHYGPAGEIDFDPASLFITGTNWKAAVNALKDIKVDTAKFFRDDGKSLEARCFVKDSTPYATAEDCVKEFTKPRFTAFKKPGIGEVLIPKFQFKVADQFDFIKNGGVLIPQPGLQRSLKNYMFTWDLKHLIPSTADRVAVLAAYRSYKPPKSTQEAAKQPSVGVTVSETSTEKEVNQPKVCVTVSDSSRGYVPVGNDFTIDRCRSLAKDAGAASFALACVTAGSMVIGFPNDSNTGQPVNLPEPNACHWEPRFAL